MTVPVLLLPNGEARLPRGMMDREGARLRCYAVLALSDAAALTIACLGANLGYMGDVWSPHGITMLLVMLPMFAGMAVVNRSYSGATLARPLTGAVRVGQALFFSASMLILVAYFLKAGHEFSRAVLLLGTAAAMLLMPAFRLALHGLLRRMLHGSPWATVVIRDGVDHEAQQYDIVVTPEQLHFDPMTSDPIAYHLLAHAIGDVDRVLVACPDERAAAWASVLKSMAVNGEILTDHHDPLGLIGVGRHGDCRTMIVSAGPMRLRERLIKRVFDLAASTAALLVLGLPLIAIAIAIRLESRGGVFFRQERIGRDNRMFRIYKFRSMYADQADAAAETLTRRGDARVTRVGKFIRRTSIDELPQLFNVLKGDMSMVGPRPHALSAKAAGELYWNIDERYRYRHVVKPGITGLAQIRGYRGATDHREDLTNRLQSDLEYVARWSIWSDLWIVARTLGVISHHNAF